MLVVTLLLLTGHQAMYTYIAPFAARSGFGRISLVLFVFGAGAVVGIWITGMVADRRLRPALVGALPWVTSAVIAAALATVVAAPRYRHKPGKEVTECQQKIPPRRTTRAIG